MKMIRFGRFAFAVALTVALSALSQAATTQVSVLLDTDNRTGTGCSVNVKRANVADVAVPIGPQIKSTQVDEAFPGVEQRLSANVEIDATGYRIRNVTRESCSNGTLGAPTTVVSGPLLIERGQGNGGATAVEIVVPSTVLALPTPPLGTSPADIRMAIQTESQQGNAAGITGGGPSGVGGPPLATPVAALFGGNVSGVPVGGVGATALLIALISLAAFVKRKKFVGTLVAVLAVGLGSLAFKPDAIAQLIQFVSDGRVDEWAGIRPLYSTTNNTQNGVETTAVYVLVNGQTAAFRVDVNLNAPPSANAQAVTARSDTPTPIVLSGRDAENSPLTFRLVSQPRNGALTGAAPNLIYTPQVGFTGSDSFDFVVRDGVQDSAPATVSINVQQAATFTSANSARFAVGQDNTFIIRAQGQPAPRITLTGSLPSGITFTDNNDGTATLAGRPATNQVGTYLVTVNAANGVGAAANQSFSLVVFEDAAFTSAASLNALEGQPVNFDITLRGTFDALVATDPATSLPAGLAYSANGATAGRITGTPAVGSRGTYSLRLAARGGTPQVDLATQTLTINVTGVNQKPSFTPGPSITVNEDAPPQTIANWATNVSAGAASESGQTLTFDVVSNSNAALFSAAPSVSASGTLTFTPAADANGSASISLRLRDNGGTANGGVDTSDAATLTITVNAVNDPPRFTKGADVLVSATATPSAFSQTSWATGISTGPPDEASQSITFLPTVTSGSALFTAPPAISPTGTLTFTPAANAVGIATVTVIAQDTGGIANGGANSSLPQTFTISLSANQPPSFVKGANITLASSATPMAFSQANWATAISPGPISEATQTVTFNTTVTSGAALFSVTPQVASNGSLTFTPAANASGVATMSIVAKDNGGTANGGQDTSAPQSFTVSLTGPPSITSTTAAFFNEGVAGSFDITTSGAPAVTSITLTGCPLPPGLAFASAGSSATISGTPTFPTTVFCTITASNGQLPNTTQVLQVTVSPASSPPAFTFASGTTNASVGVISTTVFPATGTPTPTVSLSGCAPGGLPVGLMFTGGSGSASISGSPAMPAANVVCTITATNSQGTATIMQTFNVFPPIGTTLDRFYIPTIGTTIISAPVGVLLNDFFPPAFPATVTSFGPMGNSTLVTAGSPGLFGLHSVTINGNGSVTVTPNPTMTVATIPIEYRIANGLGSSAIGTLDLRIGVPPTITSPNYAIVPNDVPSVVSVTSVGDGGLSTTLSLSGCSPMLPPGITFTDNLNGTGTINTPAGGPPQTYDCTITANNGVVPVTTQPFRLYYQTTPPPPTLDKAFSGALVSGGTTTLTFAITNPPDTPPATFSFTDSLPTGLAVGVGSVGGTCGGGTVTAMPGAQSIIVSGRQVGPGGPGMPTTCTITVPVTTSAMPTVGSCPLAANTNGNAQIGMTTNIASSIADTAAGGGAPAAGTGACVTVTP